MKGNKESRFVKWWRSFEEQIYIASTKAPMAWGIFWCLLLFASILIIFGFLYIDYQKTRAIPFEVEGSCNTGFIGIDFKSVFDNQPYMQEVYMGGVYYHNGTKEEKIRKYRNYERVLMPKELNLKNIDGLNCNFKIKGAIPYNQLQEVNW